MSTGYRSQHRPAKRRSRNLKMAIEPLFQYRDGNTFFRREGIVKPIARRLGRDAGVFVDINNPAYLEITPAFEIPDGQTELKPLDIKKGDLFIRLKYLDGTDTTDTAAKRHATRSRVSGSLEVHTHENRYNVFRILGDLT